MNMGNPNSPEGEFLKKMLSSVNKKDDAATRAFINDQRLTKLAEYEATQGYMNMNITPDDLQASFHKLKGSVMKGSHTIQQLEDDVYSRWGVTKEDPTPAPVTEELGLKEEDKQIQGFTPNSIHFADIPEDSPENH